MLLSYNFRKAMLRIQKAVHSKIISTIRLVLISPVLAVLIAVSISVSQVALAASEKASPHQEILNLLKNDNAISAYQLAQSYLIEWEGELPFDLAYGLAAKAAGHLEKAVFPFERVLDANPNSDQIRYFLAVTYFEIGNLEAAQKQFNLLQQSSESIDYQKHSQQYLNVIARKIKINQAHWQNWAQLSFGFDDNANNGIKDEFIDVPILGNVRLFEQSLEIESSFTDTQLQLLYIAPQDQLSAWYAGADVRHIKFDKSLAWTRTFLSAIAGYKNRWQQLDWDINAFYRPLLLDNKAYLNYLGLSGNIAYPLNKITKLGFTLTYAQEQYDQLTELDKDQAIANVWMSHQTAQSFNQRIDLRYGKEQTVNKDTAHNDRNLWGASYQSKWSINNKWIIHGKLDYLDAKHQEVTPLFAIKRHDKLTRAEIQIEHKFFAKWSAFLKFNHLRNSSNVTLYDYDRNTALLAVSYSF